MLMQASEFLRRLWGAAPPGLIQLWRLDRKRSWYLDDPAQADPLAHGATDVYTGVGLAARSHGSYARARAHEIAAIAGLWLDIDVDDEATGKRGAAPDWSDALALAFALAPPTIVVSSGHGLHAWHLLERPWRFAGDGERTQAARAVARWQDLHRARARAGGWTIDSTHDLARLLRLPGTVNGKRGAARPVHVVIASRKRIARDRLIELGAAAALGRSSQRSAAASRNTPHRLAPPHERLPDRLRALIASSPAFAAAWRNGRGDVPGWSMSEYDLSIARQLVRAGWANGDIARAITLHRRRHDRDDPKATRVDYLLRTIAKARQDDSRAQARAQLRRLAEAGEP